MPNIQIVIDFDAATRKVVVTGPLGETAMCYGILEAAKDVIRAMNDPDKAKRIAEVPPGATVPPHPGFKKL